MNIKDTAKTIFDRVTHAQQDVYCGFQIEWDNRRPIAAGKVAGGGIFAWVSAQAPWEFYKAGLLKWQYPEDKILTVLLLGAVVPSIAFAGASVESFRRTGVRARVVAADDLANTFD